MIGDIIFFPQALLIRSILQKHGICVSVSLYYRIISTLIEYVPMLTQHVENRGSGEGEISESTKQTKSRP